MVNFQGTILDFLQFINGNQNRISVKPCCQFCCLLFFFTFDVRRPHSLLIGCRPKADWIRVVGKSADSVTVEWLVPHDCRRDHGPNRPHHLAIDSYRVFIRPAIPAGTVEAPWKPVADLDHYMNRLVVGNLSRDRSYYFGVAVVNQSGQGEIISTKEPVSPEAISSKFSGINVFRGKKSKFIVWSLMLIFTFGITLLSICYHMGCHYFILLVILF